MALDPRLPVLRESLLGEHGNQIVNATTENGQHGGRIGAAEHIVKQALRVLRVFLPSLNPPLAQSPAEIGLCEKLLTIRTLASGALEEPPDELEIRLALVWDECRVAAGQAGVVLNFVVLAEFFQVEAVGPVGAVEKVCGEGRDEEAECRREVVGLVYGALEVAESDVAAGVRKDAVVSLCNDGSAACRACQCGKSTHWVERNGKALTIAFSIGQADLESPSLGAT